jgi:protocatechuate 3,4-dioxygenase beta subunit
MKVHRDEHDDFGGLHRDLLRTGSTIDRRQLLWRAASFGISVAGLHLFGCSDSMGADDGSGACAAIPDETAGPFPGDGSNGPSVLNQTGVVRSDIKSSFAGLTGTADGVPLNVELTIISASTCAPLANHAVYIWHCDRLGRYSLYSSGATSQNYLRGVQETDSSGKVTFQSIFPACYQGRWPHIHFEVYPSLAAATNVNNRIATSQIALPKATCDLVYATTGYEQSIVNLSRVSLSTDMVFADSASLELATVDGNVASVLFASLTVAV